MLFRSTRNALRPVASAYHRVRRCQSSLASNLSGLKGRHFLSIDELRCVLASDSSSILDEATRGEDRRGVATQYTIDTLCTYPLVLYSYYIHTHYTHPLTLTIYILILIMYIHSHSLNTYTHYIHTLTLYYMHPH